MNGIRAISFDLDDSLWAILPVIMRAEEVIDAHCRERIAAFKRPRQVVVVSELPKTATGKIQRFALRDELARQ